MGLRRWIALLLVLIVAIASLSDRPSPPSDIHVIAGITYVPGGSTAQRMDLYTPAAAPGHAWPVIIWLHDGAWCGGSKSPCPGIEMVRAGYALASVEYRFSTVAKFPAQIQDCRAAVRWLRGNHRRLHLDSDHIGVIGASAGGHLAAMLGTIGDKRPFPTIGEYHDQSARVQAVCDLCGPSDFTTFIRQGAMDRTVSNAFLTRGDFDPYLLLTGKHIGQDPAIDAATSPVTYIDAHAPPFLILHGTRDSYVPFAQSVELANRLQLAGVNVRLRPLAGGGHDASVFDQPSVAHLVQAFFDEHLKDKAALGPTLVDMR